MNKNQKEKTVQILIRTKPKDKEKIKSTAKKCNLSVSEYMLQRALGYEPRTIPPDAFYEFTEKLGNLYEALRTQNSAELQAAILKLLDEIYAEFLTLDRKDSDN